MYQNHWKLDAKPFQNGRDARFYYPSVAHQGALLKLRYVIENHGTGALLTGGSGLGKSLLISALFDLLPNSFAPLVHLVFPRLAPDEFLAYLADEISGRTSEQAVPANVSVRKIQQKLTQNSANGQHAVVAIDDAQMLRDTETLDMLRLLMNFEAQGRPAMTLVLAGQGSILPAVERVPSLDDRLGVKCVLRPFAADETASYLLHRLAAAGGDRAIFADDALDRVHELSAGVPRRINRLCELALLMGYAEDRHSITAQQIEEVSSELITIAPE